MANNGHNNSERSGIMKISKSNIEAARAISTNPGAPCGSDTITISDVNIPFWRIVSIMVKWSLASIPAFIILAIIGFCIFVVLAIPGVLVMSKIAGH